MTTNHTAPEMLEAVGLDWKEKYGQVRCPECALAQPTGVTFPSRHMYSCRRPSLLNVEVTYTGPEIGTPELDGILLVAGQRWCAAQKDSKVHGSVYTSIEMHFPGYEVTECYGPLDWLVFICKTPGHALARAIREVGK